MNDHIAEQFEALARDLKQDMRDSLKMTIEAAVRGIVEVERDRTGRAIREAILEHRCDCPLNECEKPQVRHLMGMLNDLGSGDQSAGIREMRANHVWTAKLRRTSDRVSVAAVIMVVTLIVSGVVAALWSGIKLAVGGDK